LKHLHSKTRRFN